MAVGEHRQQPSAMFQRQGIDAPGQSGGFAPIVGKVAPDAIQKVIVLHLGKGAGRDPEIVRHIGKGRLHDVCKLG